MQKFFQFALLGLGSGAAYALFAQGAVLIYRGSGVVNFAHGALGMLASYVTFRTLHIDHKVNLFIAVVIGIASAVVVALAFQHFVLWRLRKAAAIVRLIATIGLLAIVTSAVQLKYPGTSSDPIKPFLPHDRFKWQGMRLNEESFYLLAIVAALTLVLWAIGRFTRVGLAITASSRNERATQTLGWSPQMLSALTWGVGAGLAGLAGILLTPSTGLSISTFTTVVTIAALAAALLGGFNSFPMTLVGGLVVGIGENLMTLYKGDIVDFVGIGDITGLNRAAPFFLILIVLVVRGRGLPLRSHVADRLPRLGTGQVSIPGVLVGAAVLLGFLFFVFNERWAAATSTSLIAGVMILSIVVLTGYAGQVSLAQWAFAGLGALFAGQLVRAGWRMELAMLAGLLLTIPVGIVFALPALRTRGVNLAVVTLGLGFTISEVIFANASFVGDIVDGGTKVGPAKLFGVAVDNTEHPHRWAVVCLIGLVLAALMVANLRRSRTGRRLLAVRTNERAAASLGISVFAVKLYAFGVAAGIAALGGILSGFRVSTITYSEFNVFSSINSIVYAVIGGLGFVLAAASGASNAVGGLGTRVFDLLHIGKWDALIGGLILIVVLLAHPDGVAAVVSHGLQPLGGKLKLSKAPKARAPLNEPEVTHVPAAALEVQGITVRFGSITAVEDAGFEVNPGEVVGLIGPNGAGKTTIIDAVTGFVKPSSGSINLGGATIDSWSASKRAKAGLRRSFQSLELFEDISVEDNIRSGEDVGSAISWLRDLFWPTEPPLSPTAVAAIKQFDLEPHLANLPGELPYGRRRLVGIARAVASGPSIIMLDEPAAGLDEVESRELAGLIRRLADERQMGVLLVEHDVGLVMSTCNRIVVIDFGRVIATGTPAEIRDNPQVRRAYLGDSDGDDEPVTEFVTNAPMEVN
jgi:ABC-type branched-subunit amino acid transport system ATPase component/ABC-type branched-subunit amino acid transport system permease subunit